MLDSKQALLAQSPSARSTALDSVGNSIGPALKPLMGTNGIILGAVALVFIVMQVMKGRGGTGKIARGSISGGAEKARARKRAIAQLKAKKPNSVALYIGSLRRNKKGKPSNTKALYLPDVQRGIAIAGGPGSGKTYSAINPLIRAALDEGMPALVYDFKYPGQAECLVAYAARRGYDVRIFAPGYPESEVCNILDFMDGPDDALMARQIASVMNRNFARSSSTSEDKFFSDAGDQLTQAILMLAKGMPNPDLMTASAVLGLDSLPDRIIESKRLGEIGNLPNGWKVSHWVYYAFSQLLQLKDSEKTVAGVIGTASKVFSRFMAPELISTFCGKTTLPIHLEGKQLVILGLDRRRREAVSPLVATVLHMMVTMNVTKKRSDPLLLAIDELPTLYLPYLTQWLNENRSDGLCTVIGFQNITQLEDAYKREQSRAIIGGCATKFIFNPQDTDSAQMFSNYLGEEEVTIKQKSRSSGGKGGASHSTSDHLQKRPIVEPAQFNRLPTGRCVLISPGFCRKDETSIPLISSIKVPKLDIADDEWSVKTWPNVRDKLEKRSPQTLGDEAKTQHEISVRMAIVQELLPLPIDGDGPPPEGARLNANAGTPSILPKGNTGAKVINASALAEFTNAF